MSAVEHEPFLTEEQRVAEGLRHAPCEACRAEFPEPFANFVLAVGKHERRYDRDPVLVRRGKTKKPHGGVYQFKRKLQGLPELLCGIHLAAPFQRSSRVLPEKRRREFTQAVVRGVLREDCG